MPHTSKWQTRGARIVDKMPPEEKYRTCCNCCHIKTGTIFLGLIELLAVSIILSGVIQQLMWKHDDVAFCRKKWAVFLNVYGMWRDCLIFEFSHFNVTLAGDYIIALIMVSIIISILFMFFGVMSISPSLLVPHLIVQAIGLIASFGYFFLYAWSYFYGDLHTQKKHFDMRSFVERMWLASILLIFSLFQCYLFLTVVKCSLYLNSICNEQKRRASQFEEVSKRVKKAKENGLWRDTSWGGTFQEYRGQYDGKITKEKEKKNRPVKGVQWDFAKNTEKSISAGLESLSTDEDRTISMENLPAKVSKQPPITLTTVDETKPTTSLKPMPHIPIRRASIELQIHRPAKDSPNNISAHKLPRPLSPTKQNSSSNESNKMPVVPETSVLRPMSTVTVQHAKEMSNSTLKQSSGHPMADIHANKKRNQLTRQKSLDDSPPQTKPSVSKPKNLDLQKQNPSSSKIPTTSKHTDMSPKRKKASTNGHSPSGEKESPKSGHKHHGPSSGSPKQGKKISGESHEMTSSKIAQHRKVEDQSKTKRKMDGQAKK